MAVTVIKEEKSGVATHPAPFFHILQVRSKLASGLYKTEDNLCLCGADHNDIELAKKDRYGIPLRMVICRECGIIRANPRMTAESFDLFYQEEYRQIYDGWQFKQKEYKDLSFINSLNHGYNFLGFIKHFDINHNVVFDIGANAGGWLEPFKEAGSEVMGVEICAISREYGETKGIPILDSIDSLLATGKKADLVILNHVLEHLLDPEFELEKIKGLIKPGGMLYVGVPGLYTSSIDLVFQNAHVWQFTSETLTYLMNICGFDEFYLDERVSSIWTIREDKMPKTSKPGGMAQEITDFLFGEKKRIPKIKTVNKFPLTERKANLHKSLSYGLPDASELINTIIDGDAVIVCGGPSVNEHEEKIAGLVWSGARLFTIERMYPYCLSHNLIPDYAVVLDASDDVSEGLVNIHPEVTHLLATQCKTDVFELLKDKKTYIFGTPQRGIELQNFWYEHGYKKATIINGGGSVSLITMAMAMSMGARRLHIFGFDCHVSGGNYAKGIAGVGLINNTFDIEVDGRVFKTTSAYLSFAQQFFQLMEMAKRTNMIDKVLIYGDSLAAHMSKENISGNP